MASYPKAYMSFLSLINYLKSNFCYMNILLNQIKDYSNSLLYLKIEVFLHRSMDITEQSSIGLKLR